MELKHGSYKDPKYGPQVNYGIIVIYATEDSHVGNNLRNIFQSTTLQWMIYCNILRQNKT